MVLAVRFSRKTTGDLPGTDVILVADKVSSLKPKGPQCTIRMNHVDDAFVVDATMEDAARALGLEVVDLRKNSGS